MKTIKKKRKENIQGRFMKCERERERDDNGDKEIKNKRLREIRKLES